MEVGESTLKALIQGENQFQVPLYQRQYSWTRSELAQLWEDILEQYDLLTPRERDTIDLDAPSHFLGSVVLAPSPQLAAHSVTTYLVIDGQQRLTTLLIALCALRDEASAEDTQAVERFNDRYLLNKFRDDLLRFRLLPTQSDRPAFFTCVDPSTEPRGNDLISQAYAFFRAALTQAGPDGGSLDIGRLEDTISTRLQFVAITCGRNDNVHRIFESLNDRGVRLTQADLLRNYLFMLLPTRAGAVYQDVWMPMQDLLTPTQLETLVFVDLVVRGNPNVKRPDIYRAQQDRLRPLEEDEAAIEGEIRELARRARLFKRIIEPEPDEHPDVRQGLARLHMWGSATTYPILLHLMDLEDRGACTIEDVAQTIAYLEAFLVRRMIVGVPTNNLNRVFNSLIDQLPDDLPIAEAVRVALSGTRKFWPSDKRLTEAIRTRPFYFQGRAQQRMMVMRRLEESFDHGEPVDWQSSNLSIEHILPQTLTDEWRDALSASGDDPDEVHDELLHSLGNLTITAYNGELSNHPFDRKKQILEGSHLELNRAVVPEQTWGRQQILDRADDLAQRAIALWPGPLAGVDEPPEGRDWTRVHAALAALPTGTWTAYSDLAELIGSHAVPVGQHLANTPGVLNAHRVLKNSGEISPDFRWLDPADSRDVREVLESEGLRFDKSDRADPQQRFGASDLAALTDDIVEPLTAEEDREYGWRTRRLLRYLSHFAAAPDGRLHEDEARELAVLEGYDPRGTAGFYQGENASLRSEGEYRVLTDAGRAYLDDNRHLLDAER